MAVVFGVALALASPAAAQTINQFDDVTVSTVPSNAPAVACYETGTWANCPAVRNAFPHALILPIVVRSYNVLSGFPILVFDDETGNGVPSQAGPWAKAEIARGVKPALYSMLSWMSAIKASLAASLGPNWRSKVLLWDANWTYSPHLDPGYDGTQWTDRALGRSLDESIMSPAFYVLPKPPPVLVKCLGKLRTKTQCKVVWTSALHSTLGALNARGCARVDTNGTNVVAVLSTDAGCAVLEQRASFFLGRVNG